MVSMVTSLLLIVLPNSVCDISPTGAAYLKDLSHLPKVKTSRSAGHVTLLPWKQEQVSLGNSHETVSNDKTEDFETDTYYNKLRICNRTLVEINERRTEKWLRSDKLPKCSCFTNSLGELTVNCAKQGLHKIPVDFPNDTAALLLNNNKINKIPSGIFRNLLKLRLLDLSKNKLNKLEPLAFVGLNLLQMLLLSKNYICYDNLSISKDSFMPLKNLQYLGLEQRNTGCDHELEQYPAQSLKVLKKLRTLDLNGLLHKPFLKEFKKLSVLRHLSLNGNAGTCNMSHISVNMFENLTQLHTLSIIHCNLTYIENGSFTELSNLTNLNLSQNTDLGFDTLSNITYSLQFLKNIKLLNFSQVYKPNGDCTQIYGHQVKHLGNTTLKELYLESNRISSFEGSAIQQIPTSIETISVKDNQIVFGDYLKNIIEGIVENKFKNLKVFIVSKQRTNHPFHMYVNFETIWTKLKKGENSVPSNTAKSSSLDSIHKEIVNSERTKRQTGIQQTQGNEFTANRPTEQGNQHVNKLPRKLESGCSNCKSLLEQGKIGYGLPVPPNLQYVDSSENKVRITIDALCFCEPNNLNVINIDRNMLWNWQGPFLGLSNLTHLSINWNYFSSVTPDAFHHLPNLEVLNLIGNYMNFILEQDTEGIIFNKLIALKGLYLAWNKIGHLPAKVFKGLSNLEELDLSNNNIVSMELSMTHMKHLKYVNLSYNMISNINKDVRNDWETIATNLTVNLKNNTFICSCNYIGLVQWFSKTKVKLESFHTYQCKFDNGSYGNLTNAAGIYQQLTAKCASYITLIICSSLAVLIAVILVTSALIYRYRWDLRYMYYFAKLRYKGYIPVQIEDNQFEFDVFVSYADGDRGFVYRELVPELEGNHGIKLLVHDRDFQAGNYINDNIMNAVISSRKTMIILSRHFHHSRWCMYELNMARMEAVKTGRDVVCVLMKEEVPTKHLPLELIDILRKQTYLQYPADSPEHVADFWNRLAITLND